VSYRKEKKFRTTMAGCLQFKRQLFSCGMKPLHRSRKVNSIYFDSEKYDMLFESEEGLLPRKKIRIRWYDTGSDFNLEKKFSSLEGRFKVSEVVNDVDSVESVLKYKLFDAMYGALTPCLRVSYSRAYFSLRGVRVTIDTEITYENLRRHEALKFKDPEQVVEVKAPITASDDFIEMVIPYSTARFSKYSRGLLLSQRQL